MQPTNRTRIFEKEATDFQAVLAESVKAYHFSVNINVACIDADGKVAFSFGKPPAFCTARQENPDSLYNCIQAHRKGSRVAEQLGEDYIFSCSSGLVHFVAPIVKDRIFCGALIAGPVLLEYPDDTMVDQVTEANGLTVRDRGKIQAFLREIPVCDPAKARHLSKLLFLVVCSSTACDRGMLQEHAQRAGQQSQIGLGIQDAKEKRMDTDGHPLEYEREKELLLKVKAGDVIGAKAILNELLGIIFFHTGGHVEIVKARLLELCTLLSRAAVEGGAALDTIFGLNYRFIGELSKLKDLDQLSFWILKVLNSFTENIFYISDTKNIEIIQKAVNYANEHFDQPLTLDDVAEQVHLNPSYFSTLFKKETGVGFSDYLAKVRIERSKALLKDRRHSIMAVAILVGFEDQSYFSKVFRRLTGISPKTYRNNG